MRSFIITQNELIARDTADIKLFEEPKTINLINPGELQSLIDLKQVHHYTLEECWETTHHARLDCHACYSYGILNAVDILDDSIESEDFNFYLTEFALVIISKEDNKFLHEFINQLSTKEFAQRLEELSPQKIFLSLYDSLIERNDNKIEEIESRLEGLEERIMVAADKEYLKEIIATRKLIMHLKHYLEPLQFFIQTLSDNENNLFTERQLKALHILSYKTIKMVENTTLLRDYATQVREAFEAERDIKANDLMKIFTVVTSVFLPLSLVVGWYGMNFKGIPEYNWKYGYQYLIGLNVTIVCVMVGLFVRKKWI